MMELSLKVVEHYVTYKTMACENDLLSKRIYEISKKNSKGKSEGSRIQFQLEEELTLSKMI